MEEWKEETDGIRIGEIRHTGEGWEVERVVLRTGVVNEIEEAS